MGAPNCNPHLNISELHLRYFRVLPVKYNYMYGPSNTLYVVITQWLGLLSMFSRALQSILEKSGKFK